MEKEFIYKTHFNLMAPVLNIEDARAYLEEDDMVKYFKEDIDIPKRLVKKVKKIEWKLKEEDNGDIIVTTNNYLTDKEKSIISEWISGQNSDGLGEGFECQDFANYDINKYDYNGNEISDWDLPDDYEEDWVMASFDWKTNDYELELFSD